MKRFRSDGKAIEMRLGSDCEGIVKGSEAIEKRLRSDREAIAERVQRGSEAIVK